MTDTKRISITYEQCNNGHEAVEHMTRKHCPLCQISELRNKVAELERMLELRINQTREKNAEIARLHKA